MAIQAQIYPENLGLPLTGGGLSCQDWFLMSNNPNNTTNNNLNCCGYDFNFNNNLQQQAMMIQAEEQYIQQQQQLYQQQQQKNSCFGLLSSSKNCTSTTTASTTTTESDYHMPMNFSSDKTLVDHLEKQRQYIDRYITVQNERLARILQEQRKQQLIVVLRKIEEKAMELVREKDVELAKATKKTYELEEMVRKMEIENQEWQRLAAENEAMVVSLNNTLEQIKDHQGYWVASASCSSNVMDEAESSCNFNNYREEIKEEMGFCKVCKSGKSCILMLPCKHLCCCKGCEGLVDVCPVCESPKVGSIEALIS